MLVILLQIRVVSTVNRLKAGQSGVQFSAGTRDLSLLKNFQTNSGAQQVSHQWVWRALVYGLSWWCIKRTTHFWLVPRLRMSGAQGQFYFYFHY